MKQSTRIILILCAVGAIILVFGLGLMFRGTVGDKTKPGALVTEHTDAAIDDSCEIVCWGDSLTEGIGASAAFIESGLNTFDASYLSYPEILQKLTGIRTYNFGVEGATSAEIAYMQGGYQPTADELADFENVDLSVMQEAASHKGDVLIIAMGSNGGWDFDYDILIAQYRSMIEYAECNQYIIVGDTDDPGSSLVDSDDWGYDHGTGVEETAWEAALREAFGEHFINMRLYLVEHGLEVTGLTPTAEDNELIAYGGVPEQLRSDWTHLNSYGYYAQALAIYQKGQELGYWE